MNDTAAPRTRAQLLVAGARYEIVPMANLESQLRFLPAGSSVSVTCSPAKGQQTTLDLTARLSDQGVDGVPHISARLIQDRTQVASIAAFCRSHGLSEVFVIAGDAATCGPYDGAVAFLRDFLAADHGLSRIGVTAYPDGHTLIGAGVIHDALHAKQKLLVEAGIDGYASTQMCFDTRLWKSWAAAERSAGLTMPLHLGAAGMIERAKLLAMGARLGIGSSLRYLAKNRRALTRLVAPGSYDPSELIDTIAVDAAALGVAGIHLFTFNNIEATARWQHAYLDGG